MLNGLAVAREGTASANIARLLGALQAGNQRSQLAGDRPRVVDRDPYALRVGRRTAALLRDRSLYQSPEPNADGCHAQLRAKRGPRLIAHVHPSHAVHRLIRVGSRLLRALPSTSAHVYSVDDVTLGDTV